MILFPFWYRSCFFAHELSKVFYCICSSCNFQPSSEQRIVTWRPKAAIMKSLLSNDSLNIFARKLIHKQQSSNFRCYERRCKHAFPKIERFISSAWSVKIGYKEQFSWEELVEIRDASLPGYELGSRRIELNWQLQKNGKRKIKLWKGFFMCNLKWHWDCCKSVARIRLAKIEHPGACVTVNCKVCRSAIALYYLQSRVVCISCQ
jgi:hypothetical protein